MLGAMSAIGERLEHVRSRMNAAMARAGRTDALQLLAVSKGHPASAIRDAFAAGHLEFGESYAQELAAKAGELSDLPIGFHFIGHLQRNKVKDVVRWAKLIHGVDRPELADDLARRATERVEVLLEINVGREPQKSGCLPEAASSLARAVSRHPSLGRRGLLTIPPPAVDPQASRPHFRALRGLGEHLVGEGLVSRPLVLSMGMSHDFEVAIEEGATLIRVGTDIFGARPAKVANAGA